MDPAAPPPAGRNLVLSLLRTEDLLALDFEFINLELRADKKGARLFRIASAPAQAYKDPPSLEVGPSGVDVGYSLAPPPLAVGVFSLQNVSLGAGLHLPFDGGLAALRFNFAERHSPFLMSRSIWASPAAACMSWPASTSSWPRM